MVILKNNKVVVEIPAEDWDEIRKQIRPSFFKYLKDGKEIAGLIDDMIEARKSFEEILDFMEKSGIKQQLDVIVEQKRERIKKIAVSSARFDVLSEDNQEFYDLMLAFRHDFNEEHYYVKVHDYLLSCAE